MQGPLRELVDLLSRLPGIGERTATRLAFHILSQDELYAQSLGSVLSGLHQRIQKCEECGNFDVEAVCSICRDTRRDSASLCVVARVQDLEALERSHFHRGLYHVLHGLLSPLDGFGADRIDVEKLLHHVSKRSVHEVILATPLSVEGEATALYLAEALNAAGISVSRIASGMPHGGELEYADQVTLGRAFEGRKTLSSEPLASSARTAASVPAVSAVPGRRTEESEET